MLTPHVFEAAGAKRLIVTTTSAGWKISEEDAGRTVRTATCTDWHRVERAIALFRQLPSSHPVYPTRP